MKRASERAAAMTRTRSDRRAAREARALRAAGHRLPERLSARRARRAAALRAYAERDARLARCAIRYACSVGGRMMLKRVMGKASFVKIADRSGQIQLFLQANALGAAYEAFKQLRPRRHRSAPRGCCFEPGPASCRCGSSELRLLAKSLRPLPDKWHGLADTEQRYRQRYVDLIMTERSREVFRARTRSCAICAISSTRSTSSKSRRR